MTHNKEGRCSICGDPGKRIAYTISGKSWYACQRHEKDVEHTSAEYHGKSQLERTQSQILRMLLDSKPINFI